MICLKKRIVTIIYKLIIGLSFVSLQAQIQVNIDNGYLSQQGWGGAIHPSGKYFIKADRSIVKAYDRANNMLFQEFQSPCIASEIKFTEDGKYLLIQTSGEIGDECNRAVVFDFYSGKLLFNMKGSFIHNYIENNKIYIRREVDSNNLKLYPDCEIMVDAYKIEGRMDFEQSFSLIRIDVDTTTYLNDTDFYYSIARINGNANFEDFYRKNRILDTIQKNYPWEDIEKRQFQNKLSITKEFDTMQLAYQTNDNYYETYNLGIFNNFLLTQVRNSVGIFDLNSHKVLQSINNVTSFSYNYLNEYGKIIFSNESRDSFVIFNLKSLREYRIACSDIRYFEYFIFESDSVVVFTSMFKKKSFSYNMYTRKYGDYHYFKIPTGGKSETDPESNGEYHGKISRATMTINHMDGVLYDIKKNKVELYNVIDIDTSLIHPAIVYTFPEDSKKLVINNMEWNFDKMNQFSPYNNFLIKQGISDSLRYLIQKKPQKRLNKLQLYSLLNQQEIFNSDKISYPVSHYFGDGNSVINGLLKPEYESIFNEKIKKVYLYSNRYYLKGWDWDSFYIADNYNSKLYKKKETEALEFIKKKYNREDLYKINSELPDFVYPGSISKNGAPYKYVPTSFPQNGAEFILYYPRTKFRRNKEVSTDNKIIAKMEYIGSLIKPSFSGFGQMQGFIINILNTVNSSEIPYISYAGIIPENDVYFNYLTFPICHNRLMSLNYAHGIFKLIDSTGNVLVKSSMYRGGGFIHTTPDGYYFGSKNQIKRISIRNGNDVYPIEQFDLQYNRRDIVLERLGVKSELVILPYKQAYAKRLKKMGFTEQMFGKDWTIPTLIILNEDDLAVQTTGNLLELQLKAMDSVNTLDRINIWVNDVPIYGTSGIGLRNRKKNNLDTILYVALSAGINRIETSVINSKGTESYKRPFKIQYNQMPDKTNIHFIGIGMDKFSNPEYNLNYSSKDIRDMAFNLRKRYGDTLQIDTLFNENVNTKSVAALKKKLLKTKINDKVIIAYSGHGLLSKDFDYYLSTYTVDFEHPEINGLPYEALENLLDSIPARQKLMLIDACHSGEVDKDEKLQMEAQAKGLGLKSKGVTVENTDSSTATLGLQNSFELMQELFVNVGKGTGATIISASAGTQFALENGELENGVFTYSILEAMNSNSSLTVSQLKTIVGKRVVELTNGMQKPTSRNETINSDWRVW